MILIATCDSPQGLWKLRTHQLAGLLIDTFNDTAIGAVPKLLDGFIPIHAAEI
jgi:hypothetical protein